MTARTMSLLTCPTCQKAFEPEETPAMPFCSHRCRHIDLAHWFGEEIRLPLNPEEADDEPDEGEG